MQIIILIISKQNFYFIKNCQYLTTVQDRNTVSNEKLTGLSVTYHPVLSVSNVIKTSLRVVISSFSLSPAILISVTPLHLSLL